MTEPTREQRNEIERLATEHGSVYVAPTPPWRTTCRVSCPDGTTLMITEDGQTVPHSQHRK